MGKLHFKNKGAYGKWLAFGHMHGKFTVPGVQKIYIGGKLHEVSHKRRKARR